MAASGNVVEIVVKTKDQATRPSRTIARDVAAAGDKAGRGFTSRMHGSLRAGFGPIRGMVRGFGPTLVAAVGIGALTKAANDFIGEAREAARVSKMTEARIKSTGGAAGLSARQFEQLAGKVSKLVAVDDEVIQSGENILATFTNIRNVGPDRIFDKATFAAVDMAAALSHGEVTTSNLSNANKLLGKALQDPIKGVTALKRAGVDFNDQQREQIKTMVESGDIVGAQKLILAELTKEFGGSAAAAVDADKKFNVWAGNVKERLGATLLDLKDRVLAGLMQFVDGTLLPGLKNAQTWFDNNRDSIDLLGQVLQSIFVPGAKNANREADGLRLTAVTLADALSSILTVILYGMKVWLGLEAVIAGNISMLASFITAGGHAVNVVDRLSGGTGHAGDAMVAFGRDLKETARRELQEIQRDARNAQAAIDRMHGKTIRFTSVWQTIGQAGTSMHRIVGQHGGIVRRPTMALIGEAGPEAVVPLDRAPGASPLSGLQRDAAALLEHMRGGGSVLEDFSFFGAGRGFGNEALRDAFNRANPGFNFGGGMGTQAAVQRWLEGMTGPRARVGMTAPRAIGGAGGPLVLNINIGGRQLAQVLVDPLRKEVRSLGGNVQVALGSG